MSPRGEDTWTPPTEDASHEEWMQWAQNVGRSRRGGAAGKGAIAAVPSAGKPAPTPPSTDTSATATAPRETSSDRPSSSTPAVSTPTASAEPMVLTVSPIGFVERGFELSTSDLNALPPSVMAKLRSVAEGTGEPVEAVVRQIAEFFVEAEDERAEQPLIEAISFYAENYIS